MSEARALTNLVGNGVATIMVEKWRNPLDDNQQQAALSNESTPNDEVKINSLSE